MNFEISYDFGRTPTDDELDFNSISGLVLNVDMLDLASYTVTGGNTVTAAVNKKSGVAIGLGGLAAPSYDPVGWNGKPCMTPNGTTQGMIWVEAAVSALLAPSAQHTIFYLFEPSAPDSNCAVFAGGVGTGTNFRNTRWYGSFTTGNGIFRHSLIDNGGTLRVVDSVGEVSAAKHLYRGTCNATQCALNLDGGVADPALTALTTAACTPTRNGLFQIPTVTPSNFKAGKFAQILGYTGVKTAPECAAIEAAMFARWAA